MTNHSGNGYAKPIISTHIPMAKYPVLENELILTRFLHELPSLCTLLYFSVRWRKKNAAEIQLKQWQKLLTHLSMRSIRHTVAPQTKEGTLASHSVYGGVCETRDNFRV